MIAKEVREMLERCYCGRTGNIEDRELVLTDDGGRALRCPTEDCGHLDHLEWLSEDTRQSIFDEVARRQPTAA